MVGQYRRSRRLDEGESPSGLAAIKNACRDAQSANAAAFVRDLSLAPDSEDLSALCEQLIVAGSFRSARSAELTFDLRAKLRAKSVARFLPN